MKVSPSPPDVNAFIVGVNLTVSEAKGSLDPPQVEIYRSSVYVPGITLI